MKFLPFDNDNAVRQRREAASRDLKLAITNSDDYVFTHTLFSHLN